MESKRLNDLIVDNRIDDFIAYIQAGKDIKNVSLVCILDSLVEKGITKEFLIEKGAIVEFSNLQEITKQIFQEYRTDKKVKTKLKIMNLHGLTPVVSGRPKGRVQAALALNLLAPDSQYIFG